jgi:hypothetical protein
MIWSFSEAKGGTQSDDAWLQGGHLRWTSSRRSTPAPKVGYYKTNVCSLSKICQAGGTQAGVNISLETAAGQPRKSADGGPHGELGDSARGRGHGHTPGGLGRQPPTGDPIPGRSALSLIENRNAWIGSFHR